MKLVVVITAVIAIGIGSFFVFRAYQPSERERVLEEQIEALPSPEAVETEIIPANTPTAHTSELLPGEHNLAVPFTSQAPNANWDHAHEEACEEASLLMANRYFGGRGIDGADDAESALQDIIAWENENLGFFESTTAIETVRVAREMLGLQAEIIENPTIDEIKRYIADGKLVIVPSAGQELHNPFFKQPGPLYHMLVIKGYTATQFITNDPGTKRGENYPYDFETILDANHDWNGGDVLGGEQVMIVVGNF